GKSRASELMQIADGRKTVEQVRTNTADRTAKTRALQSSPLRSGENADERADEGGADGGGAPAEGLGNILFAIDRQKAQVAAFKKIIKVSSLDQAAKNEVSNAIGVLITVLQSLQRAIAPRG